MSRTAATAQNGSATDHHLNYQTPIEMSRTAATAQTFKWLLASQSRSGRSHCVTLGYILYKVRFSLQIADGDAEQAPHCSLRGGLAIIVEIH